jgi:transketolase
MPSVRHQGVAVTDAQIRALELKAMAMREDVLTMLTRAGSGHSAGPLGMADIYAALYFHVLKHQPRKPNWAERDRLFLSCGHTVPIRYVAMAHAGYFAKEELSTLRQFGSRLQGHPEIRHLPGLENTSGPLGDGSPQSVGAALVGRMEGAAWRVYNIASDGELQAGITWEAAMIAGKEKLSNLTWIIDRNNIQIDGYTEDVMPLEPLHEKFAAFNWHVLEIDGHNIREFIEACERAATQFTQPTVIIAHTIPGKGVPFMECEPAWHGKPPQKKELAVALKALRTLEGALQED